MFEISYNLGGFGEINYINTDPQGAGTMQERGHYFIQKRDDGTDDWIGGMGKNRAEEASYYFLVQMKDGEPDWNGAGYWWLDAEYLWTGTVDRKPVTFGTQNLEQLRLLASGGLYLGDGHYVDDNEVGAYEFGMRRSPGTPGAIGKGRAKLAFINDPDNPGAAMLVAYAGTSTTPTIVARGIGSGF